MGYTPPMPPAEGPGRLRVAILGAGAGEADWASELGGRSVDVTQAADVEALLDPRIGLAVAFTEPAEAKAVVEAAVGREGAPPLTLLISRDADEHPHGRLLKALVNGKNDWERTFDAIMDPVALLDPQGRVVRANLGLARAVDRPIGEIAGRGYAELVGPPVAAAGDAAPPVDPISQSLEDHQGRTEETRYARLPGPQLVTTSPLRDAQGALRGLVVNLKDLGELREQQERMALTSRLADIGQLAAGVAHEINTPLASIALRAESLLKSAEDPQLHAIESFKNFPRYLKTIDEEIFRCKKIISALLDFSRARRPEVRATDLNGLVERATDLVRHQMKLKRVNLEVTLDPGLPPIAADDGQIRQAIIALLMNALDATPSGGRIQVTTEREGEEAVCLTVADTGSGIPAEHLDKIFNPFFTTKPVGQGTGLGLAITHGIVTSHGGAVRVASEVDQGTRLCLVLPLGRVSPLAAATPQATG
jgi:two-component system, NtrC family, sensor kinase